jgi:hypothetical protein
MAYNPFVEQRKAMKMQLMKFMLENKGMSEDKIIAIFSLKTGLKGKTIKEYIEEIKEALEIEVTQK